MKEQVEAAMTNDELARAIAAAWDMQHRTGRMSANYQDVVDHLAELLKAQQKRAGLMTIKTPNLNYTAETPHNTGDKQ